LLADGSDLGDASDSGRKQKSTMVVLKRNQRGYPVLPSLEEIQGRELVYKKKLIGKFIGDVYSVLDADSCC
jgi:hypothetical protein